MDIQVQENDGNLLCMRHQEKITMFIMDSSVPFKDTLLCCQCFEERNTICTKITPISKAKQMIQEQSVNQNLNSQTQNLIRDLNIFSNHLMDYKNRVIQTIDTILGIILQWIKDLDCQKNQQVNKSLLQQLQQLHLGKNDNKNDEQTLVQMNNAHSDKLFNHFKRLQNQEDLYNCHQHLKQILNQGQNQQSLLININQVSNIPNKQIIKIQEQEIINIPKEYQKINSVKQDQWCYAIAFNKTGSIMVAGCNNDIKVWKFDKGKLTELNKLTGHTSKISCLVFSKNLNWFVSGSRDKTIRGWKEQQNKWISTQSLKQHSYLVLCLLLNSNENELISCSRDKTIKVWNVDWSNNQIQFNYTLDNKHLSSVYSISLNQNETALVSCSSDKTIILWMKGQNNKWEYINHIEGYDGSRICFVSDTQFLFQPHSVNQTQIFNIENKQIIELQNQQINLKDATEKDLFFPTIYNKKRQLIILKHNKYVYLIQKQTDGTFKIVLDPIDCQTNGYGTLSEDGEYLVIWSSINQEIRVHQISY